jgi:hypothetical protein
VVAIAADDVEDMAALQTRLPRIALLTDPGLVTSAAWGVRVPGAESPSPMTFIVRDGRIRWRRLATAQRDWPTYPELLVALQ